MARTKTKKQKKKADARVTITHFQPQIVVEPIRKVEQETKVKTTVFSQSQVNLLYKDLTKTFIVTVIITLVLLSIFIYMR